MRHSIAVVWCLQRNDAMRLALGLVLCSLVCTGAITDIRSTVVLLHPVRPLSTSTVHLVFSNHLDIGFNSQLPGVPGTDASVINCYFHEYFPRAIATAAEMRRRGGEMRYRYMAQSFLVSLFLECPPNLGLICPDALAVASFDAAVRAGDIHWHALPHNAQVEVMDASLLAFSVQLTHDLDRRFGLPAKRTMSQRDVPGLTRAAVPVLAAAGVQAISVGVNSGSAPPDVPHNTPFIWRDEPSGTSLLAFWHPGGYSGV